MATQFITGNALNHELERLFEDAENCLVLISPYIKLHERYASVLRSKLENDKLEIDLVFGKNEDDPSRSMGREDLEFFMQFPNIEIRYEPRLHAKYFANDSVGLITSMNLYRYSQDHNIEAGVKMETASLTTRMLGRTDMESTAYGYFDRVIEQATLIYKSVPKYEKAMLGLTQKWVGREVTLNNVDSFITERPKDPWGLHSSEKKSAGEPRKKEVTSDRKSNDLSPRRGYCIRTGVTIPFDVNRPMSDAAYRSWSRYMDPNYGEKYCHFSGEESNGETSYAHPILYKNWKQAKNEFGL